MKIVAKTDKGLVRENNQDAYAVGELPGEVAWAVVCDGMGGAAGGNIASALAVKVISDKITSSYNEKMRDSSIKNLLDSAITAANIEVYDMAYSRPDLKGMGTTVVAVVVRDNVAHIAHAGDSRAYLVNKDGVEQITVDHSLVQNLVDRGEITKEEAEHHPNKNVITRALGVDKRIDVDFSEIDMQENETLVLCTDGLSNCVNNSEMAEDIKDGQYYAFADRLVKRANKNGGNDNITVVAIAI
ncbi:Stp1/IreP family PP2C-type Ser/Thr phosphatase [Eubacterium coprostanoligenes]|uniref:Protein phosphatase n=1 Tax=Eubacterium coprostanoligenes TaxID=290054 RepID=A0A1T4LPM8_9FIRM|nr:Stp1/IreP family PP2C-type Ser/Thr phosphatase [Eubacterium coprostanoligenes]MCI6254600.1 Stp1/IreP family PP2C-type Ser/Thr phosphatase [Eubacterium coprostanoligenes]MCI6354113.1 Stp1/IreP family PP2C-type Ser/Thr phosphatase [Eubacterium coprostanoligenes]MCI6361714.1 Stp1/IreP family PP2C-type Ser/Thr phosphatase [Eubacterium coprostanoligenes]MCI7265222.1 Stp1/IreP family PP2C-type Ser/Thr phosphatase [Eubacterium coprostanoligenes]MDD6665224.1 Stp1/IreP family PP2C-type Ser/Thr phosp